MRDIGGVPVHSEKPEKTLVATFAGEHFIAERDEGGELKIYAVGTGDFAGVARVTDSRLPEPMRIRALNEAHRRFWNEKPAA
jgi:hypothetical protein